jgi:hypothetical protein
MKRKAVVLLPAGMFAGVTVGQGSCSEATEDLEEVAGESD